MAFDSFMDSKKITPLQANPRQFKDNVGGFPGTNPGIFGGWGSIPEGIIDYMPGMSPNEWISPLTIPPGAIDPMMPQDGPPINPNMIPQPWRSDKDPINGALPGDVWTTPPGMTAPPNPVEPWKTDYVSSGEKLAKTYKPRVRSMNFVSKVR